MVIITVEWIEDNKLQNTAKFIVVPTYRGQSDYNLFIETLTKIREEVNTKDG